MCGCSWDQFNLFKPPTPPPPPVESFVLRNGTLVAEAAAQGQRAAEAELAGAGEFFRREDYDKGEKLYHHIADNEKNPPAIVQEAHVLPRPNVCVCRAITRRRPMSTPTS